MRRTLLGDLVEAAALLAAHPEPRRENLANTLIMQADSAHRYARRFGRAHRVWGNGSLMARALAEAGPRQYRTDDAEFLAALAVLADCLATRKLRPRLASVALSSHMLGCAQSRRYHSGRNQPEDCRD